MPKRVGYLWEQVISIQNCIQAEKEMAKHKKSKNKVAKYIGTHAERYGRILYEKLSTDTYEFHKNRVVYIQDSYKGKIRKLQIPCLEDQAAMQAWLIVAIPYIERHNYYYNCGSIPGAGQMRAVKALKKWLGGKKPPKWATVTDIKKFYENCPHWAVMKGLEHIFKDKKFLDFAAQILKAINPNGIGLAIGYPVSHWFANIALMGLDHELRQLFPDVKFVRYMDDVAMVSKNKKHLRKALNYILDGIRKLDMELKHTWNIFPIQSRGITFLSYRFFHGYNILTKGLMKRISRKMKKTLNNLSIHMVIGIISYYGVLKHCDCYSFKISYILPYINFNKCRRMISNASKFNLQRVS